MNTGGVRSPPVAMRSAAHGSARRVTCPRRAPNSARPSGFDTLHLSLEGEISEFSVLGLMSAVRLAGGYSLRVRIDSPGGNLAASLAVYRALRSHPCRVDVDVTGEASSGAALVALAGDRRIARPGASMLLHRPYVADTAALQYVDVRRAVRNQATMLALRVAARCGRSFAEARDWIDRSRCFTAREAVNVGLLHGVAR